MMTWDGEMSTKPASLNVANTPEEGAQNITSAVQAMYASEIDLQRAVTGQIVMMPDSHFAAMHPADRDTLRSLMGPLGLLLALRRSLSDVWVIYD